MLLAAHSWPASHHGTTRADDGLRIFSGMWRGSVCARWRRRKRSRLHEISPLHRRMTERRAGIVACCLRRSASAFSTPLINFRESA